MAQLIDLKKVTINPRSLIAEVRIADDAPLYTGDDPEGTDLIANLIPELIDHACYGDGAATFGEVLGDTELAHLLEHVTVELLARTNRAGSISAGQTREVSKYERIYELRFACPDDVLVAGALSSALWIIDWAYNGGGSPEPDIDAIANGLVALVDNLESEPVAEEGAAEEEPAFDAGATIVAAPIVDEMRMPGPDDLSQEKPEYPEDAPLDVKEPPLEDPQMADIDEAADLRSDS